MVLVVFPIRMVANNIIFQNIIWPKRTIEYIEKICDFFLILMYRRTIIRTFNIQRSCSSIWVSPINRCYEQTNGWEWRHLLATISVLYTGLIIIRSQYTRFHEEVYQKHKTPIIHIHIITQYVIWRIVK